MQSKLQKIVCYSSGQRRNIWYDDIGLINDSSLLVSWGFPCWQNLSGLNWHLPAKAVTVNKP